MPSAADTYSATWFSTFLQTIDPEQTAREVDFIERAVPRARFPRLLDLCCGPGRHALPLSDRGYDVTGIDFDERAIAAARAARSTARFIHDDVRNIDSLDATWDAAVILWASFGYFAPAGNRAPLSATRFAVAITCTGFEESRPVTPDDACMQIVAAATNLRAVQQL